MTDYQPDDIRNVALIGHGGTGKTTLLEAVLYASGVTTRQGKTEDGSTVSDYTDEETSRQLSISLALGHLESHGTKLNLVDTPGYADFSGEVAASMAVVDCSVFLLNAPGGLEVGAEQALGLADRFERPRVYFVNKLDKEHASFSSCLDPLVERYGAGVVPVQWPIGEGPGFKGVVDVLKMKGYAYDAKGKTSDLAIPDDVKVQCEEWQGKIVEAAAEADDELLEKYFDAGELTPEELARGLKLGIESGKVMPVLCGAAASNAGVSTLLDFLVEYAPAPTYRSSIAGMQVDDDEPVERALTADASPAVFVFKTVSEPHIGELSYFRVFSGKVSPGMELFNVDRQVSERLGQLFLLNGKSRTEVGSLSAGDIGGAVKLKDTHTGNTLTEKGNQMRLPPIRLPLPVLEMGIHAKAKADEEKMAAGLTRLHEEDPTFSYKVVSEIRQTIVYGQGELQFEVMISKLTKRFGVEVELEKPRIPYRETITTGVEVEYKHKKQTGGRGQFGHVLMRLTPKKRGEGFEFVNSIVGGVIPTKFIPSVEKGLNEALHEGGLSHHPVVDIQVELYDGKYHDVDSSDQAFKTAALMGFRDGFLRCKPVLLEPIYDLEIDVPDEFTGDVMGDVSSRRGKIQGMDPNGKRQTIRAQVPLSELYKYSTVLRSITQGRGVHTQSFSHYDPVPHDVADKVVDEAKAAKKAAEEG